MKTRLFLLIPACAIVLLAQGCAKPPDAEMQAAQTALEGARSAAAPVYAPATFSTAENALSEAATEVEAQGKKFALTRNYGKAREALSRATNSANQAAQEAVQAKEQARQAAVAEIEKTKTSLAAANTALAQAPAARKIKTDLDALKGRLDPLGEELKRAEEALGGEDYAGARSIATSIDQQVAAIQEEMSALVAKATAPAAKP